MTHGPVLANGRGDDAIPVVTADLQTRAAALAGALDAHVGAHYLGLVAVMQYDHDDEDVASRLAEAIAHAAGGRPLNPMHRVRR